MQDDIYMAKVEFYIKGNLEDGISDGDIKASNMMKKDFVNIIKSDVVIEEVRKRIVEKYPKYEFISETDIKNSIILETDEEVRFIKVFVKSDNPDVADDIANKVVLILKQKTRVFTNDEFIDIISLSDSKNVVSKSNLGIEIFINSIIGISFVMILILVFDFVCIKFKYKNPIYS
jgi:capsular polysaccharide biosynthesis protein